MKIKLLDTLHFSDIQREPFVKGDKMDLPPTSAQSLIDRGLAIKIEGNSKKKATGKAKAAPRVRTQAAPRLRTQAIIGVNNK